MFFFNLQHTRNTISCVPLLFENNVAGHRLRCGKWMKWYIFNTYLFMYLLTMFCHCGFLSHLLSLSEMRRHLPEPWLIRPARVEVTHSVFCYFACHENHIPWNQLLILLGRSYNFLTDRREYKMFRSRRWTTVPEQCLNFQKSSSC